MVLGPITLVQPDVVLVCDPAKLANGRGEHVDLPPCGGIALVLTEVFGPTPAPRGPDLP
jgi:hypothetical protein